MNLYINKKNNEEFLKKLKEIRIIDDFIFDRERFGKQKIKLKSKHHILEVALEILPFLPQETMIVNKTKPSNKDDLLCIGEIAYSDFFRLKNEDVEISIITDKNDRLRVNFWIDLKNLNDFYKKNYIKNLSTVNGQIKKMIAMILVSKKNNVNEMFKNISKYSNEFIIKGDKFYITMDIEKTKEFIIEAKEYYKSIEFIDIDSV